MITNIETYENVEENGFTIRKKVRRIQIFSYTFYEKADTVCLLSWP